MKDIQRAEKVFDEVWSSFTSLQNVTGYVLAQKNSDSPRRDDDQLRSLTWKVLLLFKSCDQDIWQAELRDSRSAFASLKDKFLHSLEHPAEVESFADPLSDDKSSPWASMREDESTMQEISMDVERCMPDNYYFHQPETQKMLLDVLFIWHKLNPDVGYRQGMHEILAMILWVVERDAVDQRDGSRSTIGNLFDSKYIENDTFTLFNIIMEDLKILYASETANNPSSRSKQAPIVGRCTRIMERYLGQIDPELAIHLSNIEIVPQVFLMRWLRLLFGREFPFDQVLALWDGIFCQENRLVCIDFVCISMMLRIRWDLLDADYNTAMSMLVRYPKLAPGQAPSLLVNDSLYLQEHLDTSGGEFIITKYSGKAPTPQGPVGLLPPGSPRRLGRLTNHSRSTSSVDEGRSKRTSAGFESLLQDAARGIYSRGERWGLNKAVRDAVGEVRKNVQHLQASGSHTPRQHERISSIVSDSSVRAEGSRGEPAPTNIQALGNRNKALAKMLDGAIDELWSRQKDVANEKSADDEQVKSLTTAIAKVQFVKIYLEDSSLPLPVEETTSEVLPALTKVHDFPDEEKRDGNGVEAPPHAVGNEIEIEIANRGNKVSQPGPAERVQQERPDVGNEQGAIMTAVDEGVETSKPQFAGSKHQTRPSLAESTFSWMLGQDDASGTSARSTFVASAPFTDRPRDYRRKAAYLFGDEEEPSVESNAIDRPPQTKPDDTKLADEKEDASGFKMNTLRKR